MSLYRVEYRNLLGEWKPDLRPFNREQAMAEAKSVRIAIRRDRRDLYRELRVRVLRCSTVSTGRIKLRRTFPSGTDPALLAEIERLREIIGDAVPALGCHGRDFSQRALIAACEITGSDPADWTEHPDVLARLLAAQEPEAHRTKKPSECVPDGVPAA